MVCARVRDKIEINLFIYLNVIEINSWNWEYNEDKTIRNDFIGHIECNCMDSVFFYFILIWQFTNRFDRIIANQIQTEKKNNWNVVFYKKHECYKKFNDADNTFLTFNSVLWYRWFSFCYKIRLHAMCNVQHLYMNVGNFGWKWIGRIFIWKLNSSATG